MTSWHRMDSSQVAGKKQVEDFTWLSTQAGAFSIKRQDYRCFHSEVHVCDSTVLFYVENSDLLKLKKVKSKLAQVAKQVEADEVEADYYRRVHEGEYNTSETRSNELSDGGEEEYDEDEDTEEDQDAEDVEEGQDLEEDEEESNEEGEDDDTLKSEVFRVRVLSDFAGELPDDLSIRTGDILTIKELRKDGWWLAEDSSGSVGVVPKTLVERIPESPVDKRPQDKKTANVAERLPEAGSSVKPTRSGSELWGRLKQGKVVQKTSVTDVLKAMGAMPSGFRKPTLGNLAREERHQVTAWVYPKLSYSNFTFRDLHWDPVENKLRLHTVRITRHCSIVSARMVPRVGTGVNIISRQIHIALWDGKKVLSNIHTIRASPAEKDLMIWNVVKNSQMSIYEPDFLVRSNCQLANVGILFELTVTFVRTKTGEKSDVSCGWCVLNLFQETGAPTENKYMTDVSSTRTMPTGRIKNWELPLNGGTPYDNNVELDPSSGARVTGGLMESIMRVNRQPRLVVKLAPVSKVAKEVYDLLPETLVTCVQYTPFVARFREIMAEELVQDPDNASVTDLIPDPILSTFPKVLSQPDIMDALKTIWDERSKKSLRQSMRRERPEKKTLFRNVYMDSVYPLLKLVSLPPLIFGDLDVEQERCRVILDFLARKDTIKTLLSDEFAYKPFNASRMSFDIISRHSINS